MIKPYGIYLIEFPYSDVSQAKLRPALALTKENARKEALFCFITSQLGMEGEFDIAVSPSKKNGLKASSLVKIDKITTLSYKSKRIIKGRIGYLEKTHVDRVRSKLKALFQL